MQITTIDKDKVDTDKMPDSEAEMIEIIEKSGLLSFIKERKGHMFTWACLPTGNGWSNFHIQSFQAMAALVHSVSRIVFRLTEGRYKIVIVDTKEGEKT